MKRSEVDRNFDKAWAAYTGKKRARMPREIRGLLIAKLAFETLLDPRTIKQMEQVSENFTAILNAATGKKP